MPSHKHCSKRPQHCFKFCVYRNPCYFVDKAAMNEKNFPEMGKIWPQNKAGAIDKRKSVTSTKRARYAGQSGVNFIPDRILAISGRHEINKGSGPFWQNCCFGIHRKNIKPIPVIVSQHRPQQQSPPLLLMMMPRFSYHPYPQRQM